MEEGPEWIHKQGRKIIKRQKTCLPEELIKKMLPCC